MARFIRAIQSPELDQASLEHPDKPGDDGFSFEV
jgi:hypothetical protein